MGTPYWDAVRKIVDTSNHRFNVPGHQHGASTIPDYTKYDIPQLISTVDKGQNNGLDLALKEASRVFEASRVWFLTGGASQANRMVALMLAQLGYEDEEVVVQRNAHSSFFDGIILAGLNPIFVSPSVDYQHGVSNGVTVEAVEESCGGSSRKIKAIYVVSPSYFGAVSDIRGFKKIADKYDVPLIVDNAWGSHFGFHPSFPENVLRLGADVVISSTHKMGGSLTQSAMLFLNDGKWKEILEPFLDRVFLLTQSTSTSSLLLGSLDAARATLETHSNVFSKVVEEVEYFKHALRNKGFKLVNDSLNSYPDVVNVDCLKVAVDVSSLGLTGFDVHELLLHEHGIFTEMATHNTVLFVFGMYPHGDLKHIVNILSSLKGDKNIAIHVGFVMSNETVLNMRDAFLSSNEIVHYTEAEGRVSSDMLAAYPPGIPNILPGEVLTKDLIYFLRKIAVMSGGVVRGAVDNKAEFFRVVK